MENLGVDPKLLIAQLINFGLFFFIFSRFIAKPFIAYMEQEKKKDMDRQKLTEKTAALEAELLQKEKESKERIRAEFEKQMHEAKKEAELIKKNLITEAKEEAAEIVENAKKQTAEERMMMEKQMKTKLTSLAVMVIENGLKSYLTGDMQKGVTEKVLTSLSKQEIN